jgi:hypothetical protein
MGVDLEPTGTCPFWLTAFLLWLGSFECDLVGWLVGWLVGFWPGLPVEAEKSAKVGVGGDGTWWREREEEREG